MKMVVESDMDCAREQDECHKAGYFLDQPGNSQTVSGLNITQ